MPLFGLWFWRWELWDEKMKKIVSLVFQTSLRQQAERKLAVLREPIFHTMNLIPIPMQMESATHTRTHTHTDHSRNALLKVPSSFSNSSPLLVHPLLPFTHCTLVFLQAYTGDTSNSWCVQENNKPSPDLQDFYLPLQDLLLQAQYSQSKIKVCLIFEESQRS